MWADSASHSKLSSSLRERWYGFDVDHPLHALRTASRRRAERTQGTPALCSPSRAHLSTFHLVPFALCSTSRSSQFEALPQSLRAELHQRASRPLASRPRLEYDHDKELNAVVATCRQTARLARCGRSQAVSRPSQPSASRWRWRAPPRRSAMDEFDKWTVSLPNRTWQGFAHYPYSPRFFALCVLTHPLLDSPRRLSSVSLRHLPQASLQLLLEPPRPPQPPDPHPDAAPTWLPHRPAVQARV